MKDTFDFPTFDDLQLGPYGGVDGCGCLCEKIVEVVRSAGLHVDRGYETIRTAVVRHLGGEAEYRRLVSGDCPNTLANRRKAYRALVKATEEVLGVKVR